MSWHMGLPICSAFFRLSMMAPIWVYATGLVSHMPAASKAHPTSSGILVFARRSRFKTT